MQVKFTEAFSCYYRGEKLSFSKGDKTEGWPAKRALARGVAVPYKPRKMKEETDASESDAS